MVFNCINRKDVLIIILNNASHRNFEKKMKKILSKCGCRQTVKRCVFKVQNSDKQEELQMRTLLSEQSLHLALNRYEKQPSFKNTGTNWRTSSTKKTALTSKVFENITVH